MPLTMETTREEIVRVENVSFSYDGQPVLLDVNLSIHRQDFLALIGPNGAGKTTLIRIMVGLLKPRSGRVFLFNRPVEEFRDWHKIGYIQQKAADFDPLLPVTVEEMIVASIRSMTPGKKLTANQVKERMAEVLKIVGLENYGKKKINSLSGGQQQRALIARALASEPEILLLDEPTSGVDAPSQENFYDLLGELNQTKSLTIVLVTHDYGIVNRHVNRVACLNQKLIYHGEHSEFCQSGILQEFLRGGHHLVSHRH